MTTAIALVSAAVAAWCDLRTRTVPDRLNLALLLAGVVISLTVRGFLMTAGTLLIGGALCEILFRLGLWGGGDLKLLLGLALIGGPVYGGQVFYVSLVASLPLFGFYMLRDRTIRPSVPYAVAICAAVAVMTWRDLS